MGRKITKELSALRQVFERTDETYREFRTLITADMKQHPHDIPVEWLPTSDQ